MQKCPATRSQYEAVVETAARDWETLPHQQATTQLIEAHRIVSEHGYDRTQAYIIASVAVYMRIGQLVDVPNVGVTAILRLDLFVGRD